MEKTIDVTGKSEEEIAEIRKSSPTMQAAYENAIKHAETARIHGHGLAVISTDGEKISVEACGVSKVDLMKFIMAIFEDLPTECRIAVILAMLGKLKTDVLDMDGNEEISGVLKSLQAAIH